MTPEIPKKSSEKIDGYKILSRYTLEKGKGIYRVFVNLGLNTHEDKKDYIQKIEVALKDKKISPKEGDEFILDTNFKLHLKRGGKAIFEMNLNEKPAEKNKELQKTTPSYREDERMMKVIEDLEEKQRDRYLKITLENLYGELPDKTEMEAFTGKLELEDEIESILGDEGIKFSEKIKPVIPPQITEPQKQYSSLKVKDAPKKIEKIKPKKESRHTPKAPLISKEYRERLMNYVKKINEKFLPNYKFVEEMGKKYNIDPALLIAIMTNDSTLGKSLKSSFNYGNVGNDDTGRVRHFKNPRAGIEAVARNLNLRINAYKEKLPNQEPTPKELVSGKAFDKNKRIWVQFFGEYMTSDFGKKQFVTILKRDLGAKGVRLAYNKVEKK